MDPRACKSAARAQLADAGRSPKRITLVFLLSSLAVIGLLASLGLLSDGGSSGGTLSDSLAAGARNMVLSYGISLALQLVLVLLSAGYAAMALGIRNKEEQDWTVLLRGFASAGRVLLLYVLKTLRLVLWSYVFSMPLMYLLVLGMTETTVINQEVFMPFLYGYISLVMFLVSYRYRMSYFILMDHPELSVTQALRQATAITKGHRLALFRMDLSFLPWILLSVLTCGILLIWKLPYMVLSYVNYYDHLTEAYRQRQEKLRELLEQQRHFPL